MLEALSFFKVPRLKVLFFAGLLLLTISGLAYGYQQAHPHPSSQSANGPYDIFLPLALRPISPDPLPVPLVKTDDTPPLDVFSIGEVLGAEGLSLALNKIGFHVGAPGANANLNGIGDWMASLDQAGIPIFLKSADNAGPLFEAQELMEISGVPHTLIYRASTAGNGHVYDYDVPDYTLLPEEAAAVHWQKHKERFPPELDPDLVWIETINEVDKTKAEWLGQFALETARLTLADGYRWAAFGWSSGEPEPEHWETPAMLDFLRLAAAHPDRLAIALHEYSYLVEDIGDGYPYKVGRFQTLFDICDKHSIRRPTIMISEWGWEYKDVPETGPAFEDIAWAAWLYAAYPQIRGAAIWYLGPCDDCDIANQTQQFIAPMEDYSLGNYFAIVQGGGKIDTSLFDPSAYPPAP